MVEDDNDGCSKEASVWMLEMHQVDLPSLLTGLAFALHPVHTEVGGSIMQRYRKVDAKKRTGIATSLLYPQAVAGIVGQAELLCACFSIPAMLIYFSAVDQFAASTAATEQWGVGSAALWSSVVGSVLLSWAAALSKEIGITILGVMVLYDVLLVPPIAATSPTKAAASKKTSSVSGLVMTELPRVLRLGALCLAGLLYVKTRSLVAGDQLVRIYRKVSLDEV